MDARDAAVRAKKGRPAVPAPAEAGEAGQGGRRVPAGPAAGERRRTGRGDPAPAITADTPAHYFRMMKELALLGYFTSEIGCTQAHALRGVAGPLRSVRAVHQG